MMSSSDRSHAGEERPKSAEEKSKVVQELEAAGVGTDDEGFLVVPPGVRLSRTRLPGESWVWHDSTNE